MASSATPPISPNPQCFAAFLTPLRKRSVVHAKRPFGGPEAMLAYLSRHTHRVAIANSRLIAFDQQGIKSHGNLVMLAPSRMSKGWPTGDELSRNEYSRQT